MRKKSFSRVTAMLTIIFLLTTLTSITFASEAESTLQSESGDSQTFYEQLITETKEILSETEENVPLEIQNKILIQADALKAHEKLINYLPKDLNGLTIYPEEYGGCYIDDNGTLVIQIVNPTDSIKNWYREITESNEIQFEDVEYSIHYLENLQAEVEKVKEDYKLTSYNVDILSNKFVVAVEENDSMLPLSVYMATEVGSKPISLKTEAPAQFTASMYGGDRLYNSTTASYASLCFGGTYGGYPAILTCGHYNVVGDIIKWGNSSLSQIGYVKKRRFAGETTCMVTDSVVSPNAGYLGDFAIVRISGDYSTTKLVRSSPSSLHTVTGYYSSVPVGTTIYKYGYAGGYAFGEVQATSTTIEVYGEQGVAVTVKGLTKSSIVNQSLTDPLLAGDSGGCVYTKVDGSYKISGIVTAGSLDSMNTMYHTPIYYAINEGFQIAS